MARFYCAACYKPKSYCYCHTLSQRDNHCSVLIIRHSTEKKHAVGTANIAALSLTNCRIIDVDRVEENESLVNSLKQTGTFLVYPSQHSREISSLGASNCLIKQLVFLDGTWRKTRRMYFESPLLQSLPAVHFENLEGRYRIRKAKEQNAVSTLEAVIHALTVLEPEQDFTSILKTMDWMIERQIEAMGDKVYKYNYLNEKGLITE